MAIVLPEQARVGKILPKNTFFKRTKVDTKTRQEFANLVQRIVWQYKLAQSTIGVPPTKNVEEIQIFTLELKEKIVPKNIIKVIDKAVSYPVLYQCIFGTHELYAIALTGQGETRYYYSEWDVVPIFHFTNTNLETLYQAIVGAFITEIEVDADFAQLIQIDKDRTLLERDIAALKNKIKNERQFNKKVELNSQLIERQNSLSKLLQNKNGIN